MMDVRLGMIGCGNMGEALISGLLRAQTVAPHKMVVSDLDTAKVSRLVKAFDVVGVPTNAEVAAGVDWLILAVKPQFYDQVLPEIASSLSPDTVIVSLAAGRTLAQIAQSLAAQKQKIIRAMPNTPALIGAGLTALVPNDWVAEAELAQARTIFQTVGHVTVLNESQLDAFGAVASSSPAFVFMMIEAMADGAVKLGLPRAAAIRYAAEAVAGSARLVLESGEHPDRLKDQVCSPAGSTIYGVHALEQAAFRAALIGAIETTAERTREMAKQSDR